VFYTYVIISESTGKLYIGSTGNLEERITRHNQNRSKATKSRGPWKLFWARPFPTRSQAAHLEYQLKRFKNHAYLVRWIEQNKNEHDLIG
jgi:putative endonuclease